MTRRGRRPSWDIESLRTLLQSEGIDTRTWISLARVDDDEDAIRWDHTLGFIVDVTIQGGPLDQTGPIACRLGSSFVQSGGLRSDPPTLGALVGVMLSEGSPNASVVIVAIMSTPDLAAPTTVNGQDVTEDFAMATHILKSTHSVQQEVGETWRTSATSRATLEAPEVRAVSDDADQPFVRGDDFKDAINAFADAVQEAFNELVVSPTAPVLGAQASAALTSITTAVETFKLQADTYLSTKFKGE